jgi:hypothetical protein
VRYIWPPLYLLVSDLIFPSISSQRWVDAGKFDATDFISITTTLSPPRLLSRSQQHVLRVHLCTPLIIFVCHPCSTLSPPVGIIKIVHNVSSILSGPDPLHDLLSHLALREVALSVIEQWSSETRSTVLLSGNWALLLGHDGRSRGHLVPTRTSS